MIRKFFRRLFPGSPAPAEARLRILPFQEHGVARNRISPCAVRVTGELQKSGFSAYVVGGAVRDLLLGKEPKDFDIATDARPEQVRSVFRRSRIIGRRFRLVHVICGDETVEVSTFRGPQSVAVDGVDGVDGDQHSDEHGRILRDNVFGSQEEDALRRDFTVNALFYNPATQEIWDYVNGAQDVKARKLRMIGDPEQRYREDPIRMLRGVRLAAKLGMEIDGPTAEPIGRLADLLGNVPAARVFDEMLKLLLSGHSAECILSLRRRGLHHGLLPMLDVILEQPLGERFVMMALQSTDERVLQEKPVSPAFLFAALLWHEVLAAWRQNEEAGERTLPALYAATDAVLSKQDQMLAIPRRYDAIMKELWAMQPRFVQRSGRRPFRLLETPRFRAGFDFLVLRCQAGELDAEIGQWWETFQRVPASEREQMLVPDEGPKKKRRRRRRRGLAGETAGEGSDGPAD